LELSSDKNMKNPDQLFAHLGAHKTGSTYLQEIFQKYRETLSDAGVYYMPRDIFHHSVTRENLQWKWDVAGSIPVLRGLFRNLIPSGHSGTVLISDEAMSGHILGDLKKPSDRFYMDCDQPVSLLKRGVGERRMAVIFFIRTIDEFLESCYLQLVRLGATMSFEEYVAGFDIERISWIPTIEKLMAPLGSDDHVRVYDHRMLAEDPRGVLVNLFGLMAAAFPADHCFGRRVNESFTPSQYKAVMVLNRFWPAGRAIRARRWVLKAIRSVGIGAVERVRFFDPHLREILKERHRSDLAAIRDMGGIVKLYPN
jgi:hypothetical protein